MKIECLWYACDKYVTKSNFERKYFKIKEGYVSVHVEQYEFCVINGVQKIAYLKLDNRIIEGFVVNEGDTYLVVSDNEGEIRLLQRNIEDTIEVRYN